MGNMLRRGESSWLYMTFDLFFFTGRGISMRVLRACSCLAWTVNALCLFCLADDSVDRIESEHIIDLWVFVAPEYSIE